MILIFDLDDTLYPERLFVAEGMKSVSNYLGKALGISEKVVYEELMAILDKQGRGKVFDTYLGHKGVLTKELVKKCVAIYRQTSPKIDLPRETVDVLGLFSNRPLYLVTDGNHIVQAQKVKALGLENTFEKIFFTHRYGVKNSKPSLHCFEKIARSEGCYLSELIYVGDDPSKDFIELNKAGATTIRVLTGNHKDVISTGPFTAKFTISKLSELPRLVNGIESRN